MTDLNYLKNIINGRTVAIMIHGSSINELEKRILEFKDYDICWSSLGVFPMMEDFILSKINKKLEIVLDCATVAESLLENYELNVRVPKLEPYLSREDKNIWITTHGLIRDSVSKLYPHFLDLYGSKMVQVDSFFPLDNRSKWMDVPNSVTFLIASAIAGGASKIIVFGLDGYRGSFKGGIYAYYKPHLIKKEREAALGTLEDPGINRDTDYFQDRFSKILEEYYKLFSNPCPIYNCSPDTVYNVIPKINYNRLSEVLNERTRLSV